MIRICNILVVFVYMRSLLKVHHSIGMLCYAPRVTTTGPTVFACRRRHGCFSSRISIIPLLIVVDGMWWVALTSTLKPPTIYNDDFLQPPEGANYCTVDFTQHCWRKHYKMLQIKASQSLFNFMNIANTPGTNGSTHTWRQATSSWLYEWNTSDQTCTRVNPH
jgi:hypothetical protein